jgi:hypothetical protein
MNPTTALQLLSKVGEGWQSAMSKVSVTSQGAMSAPEGSYFLAIIFVGR